jgi:deoxyribodipyrimidine photo-lyase
LEEYGVLTNHVQNKNLVTSLPSVDWENVSSKIRCREDVVKVGSFIPGEKAAHDLLQKFITSKLETYEVDRNKINSDGQSNLSPYIAHGAISRRRILLEVLKHTKKTSGHGLRIEDIIDKEKNGSNGTLGSVASFVEECLVRAELSENFCYYSLAYDSYDGFPLWAKETLRKALTDIREYVYTRDQFERAETHDDLWNAAQMQMVTTGKMHGYMRMYWAKKILEWSATPEDAMRTAVYLNDVYELDGRDPNGYVGCAWSIGGVHDRPWFGRPIFGAIRYMAESGVAKRGKVKEYIEKWSTECSTLF